MPAVLLRPHFLAFKNRVVAEAQGRVINRDLLVVILSGLFIVGVYASTYSFIEKMSHHPQFTRFIAARLLHICLFAFEMLLFLSSAIAALSYLFVAKDLQLLLMAPISRHRLYLSRLLAIAGNASWMFLLFGSPSLFAFGKALNMPVGFYVSAILMTIPFVLLPAIAGSMLVLAFVNLVPPHRLRDILVLFAFVLACVILALGRGEAAPLSTEYQRMADLLQFLGQSKPPGPSFLPSRWCFDVLAKFVNGETVSWNEPQLWLLFGGLVLSLILSSVAFDKYFLRGWGIASHSEKNLKGYGSGLNTMIGRIIVPLNGQLRAICTKELRMFIRDTTQSLQMLMLLMLTFVYLYNFRTLRTAPHLGGDAIAWWNVVLSISNVTFGACVISAITTRFVFPSVSLEGRAYTLIRATPLTIEELLRYKFRTWFVPISLLAVVLLVSGSMAIQASIATIIATAFVAVSLASGIVGLGVGIGAVYAKFDWESPA